LSVPYLAVVVPAYNEEPRILPTLERLREYFEAQPYRWSVTVVSDGSTDRTNEIVQAFCDVNPCFHMNGYRPNRGKGHAVRKGMLDAEGELVLFSDADLAAPIEEIEKLLPHIRPGVEIAIGSRPLKESRLEVRQPFYREMLGRTANKLIQLLAVRGIQDTQCGFKLFTKEAAVQVFSRCKLDGFSFDFESLMIARDLGLHIEEVPIRWSHQEGSKVVLWRDVPKSLIDLIRLRLMGKKRRLALSAS
jgi:dolichyl-phosphate beta-glucosyltransferase